VLYRSAGSFLDQSERKRRIGVIRGGAARLGRLSLQHGAHGLQHRGLRADPRVPADHQLEQQQTQRINIGRRGDGIAGELLGCCTYRRQRHRRQLRQPRALRIEQFGYPEIQQFHGAVFAHQNVRGFQIAMHDEMTVGVRHRLTHLDEQFQPAGQRRLLAIAVFGYRHAFDEFHHHERAAVADAAIIEPRDA